MHVNIGMELINHTLKKGACQVSFVYQCPYRVSLALGAAITVCNAVLLQLWLL